MKALLQETLELRDRYDDEPVHSDHVAAMALQIFDGVSTALQLNARARELLHSGALLHDIGWSQTTDGRKHHKVSARLIQAQTWDSLTAEEIQLVAQIARYHRRSMPKPEHEEFQRLSVRDQKLVSILGGILRIADALDRSHTGQIAWARARISDEAVLVEVEPNGKWEAELSIFNLKRDLLELVLERPVLCQEVPASKRNGK